MINGPTLTCPSCGAENPTDPAFVEWCSVCDWNVDPDGNAAATLAAQPAPATPLPMLLRLLLVGLVHAVILATLAGGLALIWSTWFSIIGFFLGSGFVALGALLLPHGGKLPERSIVLTEAAESDLYRYVREVAEQHDVAAPRTIGFGESFQNWSGVTGTFRRPAVVFSYPIWQALERAELDSFVATELEVLAARGSVSGPVTEAAIQSLATVVSGSRWERPTKADQPRLIRNRQSTMDKFDGSSTAETLRSAMVKFRPERLIYGLAATIHDWLNAGTESASQAAVIEAYGRVSARRGPAMGLRMLDLELMSTSLINASVRARHRDESMLEAVADYAAALPDRERERRRREAAIAGTGASGAWPSIAARSAVLTGTEPNRSPLVGPSIGSKTLRGKIEVGLFDRLKPV